MSNTAPASSPSTGRPAFSASISGKRVSSSQSMRARACPSLNSARRIAFNFFSVRESLLRGISAPFARCKHGHGAHARQVSRARLKAVPRQRHVVVPSHGRESPEPVQGSPPPSDTRGRPRSASRSTDSMTRDAWPSSGISPHAQALSAWCSCSGCIGNREHAGSREAPAASRTSGTVVGASQYRGCTTTVSGAPFGYQRTSPSPSVSCTRSRYGLLAAARSVASGS